MRNYRVLIIFFIQKKLNHPIMQDVMTQVFAAINHRLSEEYGKIELPNPEAKSRCVAEFRERCPDVDADVSSFPFLLFFSVPSSLWSRLLADAKFLHQKLSALKNVSAPSGMLETVIAEKSVVRKGASATAESPKGSSNANQRSKGMVFRSPVTEKALPTPVPEVNNGMGRKGDINGRVNARLSSLMSPPASLPAIPREGDNMVEPTRDPLPQSAPPQNATPMPRPLSATAAKDGVPVDAVPVRVESGRRLEEVRDSVSSPPPEGSPPREGNWPNSGEEAKEFPPSPSLLPPTVHQSVDMTKPVMGPDP